jgi:O-methyltransferase involved in polyketide biosynthesis
VSRSDAISPTAHYTGYVWAHNGLSHRELSTLEGRVLFEAFRPLQIVSSVLGGASLETYLLARHLAIDALLERAIDRAGVTQVLEVACGLSPRGWRFRERYGERLTYVEADLPPMAARKRESLERIGSLGSGHRVVEVDALADDGPSSIADVAASLDPARGVAIITEGLLGYLPTDVVHGVWRRFARALSEFEGGCYISDLHLGGGAPSAQVRAFSVVLSAFVRGRVYLHYGSAAEASSSLKASGFASAAVHRAASLAPSVRGAGSESELVHIIEASTR